MTTPMTAENLLDIARTNIQAAPYCFLITKSEAGQINARLMQPFPPEDDLTIWFGTSPRTRKVRDIRGDPQVVVAYEDINEAAAVTLFGVADLVEAIALRRKYWRDGPVWPRVWPDGPAGDDYVLIRFVPARIEMMNGARDVMPDPYGLRPAVLVREGERWVVAASADG